VKGAGARLTFGHRGVTGRPSVRVALLRGLTTYSFDAAGTVRTTRVGSLYRIGAWLRTDAPGLTVCLRIEEVSKKDPLTAVRTSETCFSPTTKWQHFRILRRTLAAGDTLKFSIYSYGAEKGDSFEIDAFAVLRKAPDRWVRVKNAFARRTTTS
jgi:hypothetical protein